MIYSREGIRVFINNGRQLFGIIRSVSRSQVSVGLTERFDESADHL